MIFLTGVEKHCNDRVLEARSELPARQPVLIFWGQERVEPIQQQLLNCLLPQVLDPTGNPLPEQTGVIRA